MFGCYETDSGNHRNERLGYADLVLIPNGEAESGQER